MPLGAAGLNLVHCHEKVLDEDSSSLKVTDYDHVALSVIKRMEPVPPTTTA